MHVQPQSSQRSNVASSHMYSMPSEDPFGSSKGTSRLRSRLCVYDYKAEAKTKMEHVHLCSFRVNLYFVGLQIDERTQHGSLSSTLLAHENR